jgi:hypothetical protein
MLGTLNPFFNKEKAPAKLEMQILQNFAEFCGPQKFPPTVKPQN